MIFGKSCNPYEIHAHINTTNLKPDFENNCKARNIFLNGILQTDFDRVSHIATMHEIWKAQSEFHQGTSNVKKQRKEVFKKIT